ncbi:19629_t:CDS:1, partial [Racocetra fulgida]
PPSQGPPLQVHYCHDKEKCAIKVPGLFAAGDVIHPTRIKQVVTAASDGAIAAQAVIEHLKKQSNFLN